MTMYHWLACILGVLFITGALDSFIRCIWHIYKTWEDE